MRSIVRGEVKMKKACILSLTLVLFMISTALAVTASKEIVFDKSPMGKVTFSGAVHSSFECKDCHNTDLFPKQKKGAVSFKMQDIYAGKYCGKCHDGKTAFKALGNCIRCHKK